MHFHVSTSRFTYTDATVINVEGEFDLASVASVAAPAEESILTGRPIAFVIGGSPIGAAVALMPMNEGIPVFPSLDQALDWLRDRRRELGDGRSSPLDGDEQREAIEAEMRPDRL
jgi:hypothetical protein